MGPSDTAVLLVEESRKRTGAARVGRSIVGTGDVLAAQGRWGRGGGEIRRGRTLRPGVARSAPCARDCARPAGERAGSGSRARQGSELKVSTKSGRVASRQFSVLPSGRDGLGCPTSTLSGALCIHTMGRMRPPPSISSSRTWRRSFPASTRPRRHAHVGRPRRLSRPPRPWCKRTASTRFPSRRSRRWPGVR